MRIEHIDDVLPVIAGRTDFVVAEREGYTAIDYVYALPDSFDDPIRRECRGLKFDRDGKIIARPFHKFYNIGERPATQPNEINFNDPHLVMDKRDGSMIHPAMVDGELILMTRMGRSDQARDAEQLFLDDRTKIALRTLLSTGITPIFEYTGPKNRIILRYETPELTLLAARNTVSGDYTNRANLHLIAADLDLPIVAEYPSDWQDALSFISFVRAIQGREGFVIHFTHEDAHPERLLLKAKGDDYVLKHKSKDAIGQEKNVLALILTKGIDDVLPLLSEEEQAAIDLYREAVVDGMAKTVEIVTGLIEEGKAMDQKSFAVDLLGNMPSLIRQLAFAARRSGDADAEVSRLLLKNVSTQTQVDAVRDLFGANWTL